MPPAASDEDRVRLVLSLGARLAVPGVRWYLGLDGSVKTIAHPAKSEVVQASRRAGSPELQLCCNKPDLIWGVVQTALCGVC